jgi:hypothetical protein
MVTAIFFYDVVLAVHIASIVLAFGVTFAYPIMGAYVTSRSPEALPALHGAQARVGQFLIFPFGVLALVSGAYMASDRDYFGETWVVVPLLILLVILAAGALFFGPTEQRLQALAERDLAQDGKLGPEYEAVLGQLKVAGTIAPLLVLVAIFFMTAKPFA